MKSLSSNTNISSGTRRACGACRVRRRRCDSGCAFADAIPHDEPHKYTALCEMYNIKWVEEELRQQGNTRARRYFVGRLLDDEVSVPWIRFRELFMEFFIGRGGVGGHGTKRRSQPCGACKEKKRECKSSCVFAGAIPYKEPEKYQKLNKVFNIKRIEEVLRPLNYDQRIEVVNLFLNEADRLIKELAHSDSLSLSLSLSLSPGCGNHIRPGIISPPQHV